MTEAERHRLTDEWFAAHSHEWDAWNELPLTEQAANLDKIGAAGKANGPAAGRQMAQALGLPMPPDELADPDEVLTIYHTKRDRLMRRAAADLGLSTRAIEELLSPTPSMRMDH